MIREVSSCIIWQLTQKATTDEGAQNKSVEYSFLNRTSVPYPFIPLARNYCKRGGGKTAGTRGN